MTKYQLASKLHEISNKRNIQGQRETGVNLINVAAGIAALVPADGGATAAVLMATGAGIGVAMMAGKMLKSYNDGVADEKNAKDDAGKDPKDKKVKKGSEQKSHEYVEHAATILRSFGEIQIKENVRDFLMAKGPEDRKIKLAIPNTKEDITTFVHAQIQADQLVTAAGIDKHEFYYKLTEYNPESVIALTAFMAKKLSEGR